MNTEQPGDMLANNVTAAAADHHHHEPTMGNDERALNLVDHSIAPASSISNFSQVVGDETASGLATDGLRKKSHPGCSVSVTIPMTGLSTPATWKHDRHNQAEQTRKRSNRSSSSMGVDSEPNNDDHVQVNDGVPATETQPRPAKRQRRTGASATTSGQKHHAARRITPATSASQNRPCNQPRLTNSPGPETLSVQGCLVRKISLSRIEYYCCFTDDQGRSTPFKPDTVILLLNNNHSPPSWTSLHDIETIPI
jgi:hypothetical protein